MSGRAKAARKRYAEIARTIAASKLVRFVPPNRLWEIKLAFEKYGPTQPAGYKINARLSPDVIAIIDELGQLTHKEVHEQTNQIARGLAAQGVGNGSRVAILCRNSRWFALAFVATLKLGADGLLLNTAFAGPQLAQVIEDQNADAVIMDEEYFSMLQDALGDKPAFLGWGRQRRRTAAPVARLASQRPER